MKGYRFVNAQLMCKKHRKTFYAPTKKDLDGITKGWFVKVNCNNERFWLEVTSVKGSKITGTVGNDLIDERNKKLVFGKKITVEKYNVHDILPPK